jgi:hypothetical protein
MQRTSGPTDQPPGDSYIPPYFVYGGIKIFNYVLWNIQNCGQIEQSLFLIIIETNIQTAYKNSNKRD